MSLDIIQTLQNKRLLGQFLQDPATWENWFTFLRAFFGLIPVNNDRDIFKQCTNRSIWPSVQAREAWLCCGVRSGKSFVISLICTYLSVFKEHKLTTGEKGYIICVSPTKEQSQIVKRYISSFFSENLYLKSLVVNETKEQIELANNTIISIISNDYKSLRGYTAVACVCDEMAFLGLEGQRPDTETIRALRGRLLSTHGPLICISSPYAKRGQLYEVYKKHYGKENSNILVWQADSLTMNPTLSKEAIKEAYEEDPAGALADYGGQFRSDIESYVSRECVEACVIPGRYELPYISCNNYRAFVDPSGGARDSMTLAISHIENDIKILDAIREVRPPFSPDQVCKDFAELLKSYHISSVTGDRYGGEFPRELFRKYGITYNVSNMAKSDLYKNLLPLINSGRVELLDNPKMINQLVNLERRTGRGGRDSIDHPPNSHDDLINSVAGALLSAREWVCPVTFADGPNNLSDWLNGE